MARQALTKNENRRTRSFNLDDDHYRELKKQAQEEGLSMSDIINRVLYHGLAKEKVAQDIENGLQTTLDLHKHPAEVRAMRSDGKCNPLSLKGKCGVCWS